MPKEDSHERKILYLKADSVNDLCRYACNFDFTSSNLILTKDKKLVALGERIDGTLFAYYVITDAKSRFVRYTPSSIGEPEDIRFVNSAEQEQVNSNYISIINVDLSSFKNVEKIGKKSTIAVEVGSVDDLINMIIKKAVRSEVLMHVYSFTHKNKQMMGTFDLIDELSDDSRTFYYAYIGEKPKAGFARYSFTDNKLDFTNIIGEHSYMYVKIIGLSEPFPFLKE